MSTDVVIGLSAVVIAIKDGEAAALTVRPRDHGQVSPLEGLPFGPLAHAFRSLMRTTSPEQLDAFIGPARSELAQVLPDLDPDRAHITSPLGEGGTARLLELVVMQDRRIDEGR